MRRRSHPADLTDLHILVVEDNELNLEIAVFSLEAAGLNVSTAINGLEAVQLFEKSKPYEYDIILMDIMMPVMNGLDAAKAIRGLSRPDAPTVPIIALSAMLLRKISRSQRMLESMSISQSHWKWIRC